MNYSYVNRWGAKIRLLTHNNGSIILPFPESLLALIQCQTLSILYMSSTMRREGEEAEGPLETGPVGEPVKMHTRESTSAGQMCERRGTSAHCHLMTSNSMRKLHNRRSCSSRQKYPESECECRQARSSGAPLSETPTADYEHYSDLPRDS